MPQKDPCQKQACAIQRCLQANKYIESLCEDVIQATRKCCDEENLHHEFIFQTAFLSSSESLRYTYNKYLYLDYCRLVAAAE
uniref:C-x(9)-C motif containing 4 homolog (S. cerevisiae) n=1 Tax=Sinocyclocheilus anshuiensis TaxID=1608454 RepID=A0A671KG81_9TELE